MSLSAFCSDAISLLRGTVFTVLLGGAGLFFCVRLRFFFLRHPLWVLRATVGSIRKNKTGISPFRALCVALGGTVGVGNTVGVAIAIAQGGAGAVFWMWISALLGMGTKYAEVFLSLNFRNPKTRVGGAMVLLKEKLGKPKSAAAFCVFCIAASFGMGNLAQSGAAAASFAEASGLSPLFCGAGICILCLVIFSGGLRRLAAVSGVLVPLMSGIFLFLCLWTLCRNAAGMIPALRAIVRDAFSFEAAGGGITGYLCANALRTGFCRGIFSNEAGLGSTPLVHSEADSSPCVQGLWGIFEVFCDTILICTMSALCILSSPAYAQGMNAAALCARVFTLAAGKTGGILFAATTVFFAAASILAWGYFGAAAVRYLFARHRAAALCLYYLLFFAAAICGSVWKLDSIVLFSDLANVLMALPNLYAVFLLRTSLKIPETPP